MIPFVHSREEIHDGVWSLDGGIEATGITTRSATDPERITARVPAGAVLPGLTTLVIRNADGQESEPWPFTVAEPGSLFVRGDANLDHRVDIGRSEGVLHLFAGEPVTCLDALDTNDSGSLEITDAILLLDHLFRGGVAPSEPHPYAGEDPTPERATAATGCRRPARLRETPSYVTRWSTGLAPRPR